MFNGGHLLLYVIALISVWCAYEYMKDRNMKTVAYCRHCNEKLVWRDVWECKAQIVPNMNHGNPQHCRNNQDGHEPR